MNNSEERSNYQQLLGLSRELSRNSQLQKHDTNIGSPYLSNNDWEANSQPDMNRDFRLEGQSVGEFSNDFDRGSLKSPKSIHRFDTNKK